MASLKRVWIPSPNYSSRGGMAVRLIVLHTAEGARTFEDLGHFFGNGSAQVSSHVGIDDTPGTIGEFVKRQNKAWHVAAFNPVAVGAEQCAFASWTRNDWLQHPHLIQNAAMWVAEEAAKYNIPIVALTPQQAQSGGRGVCQHRDLGPAGGGHNDCGDGYPIDIVLNLARGHADPSPVPAPLEEDQLITSAVSENGTLHVFELRNDEIYYTFQGSAQSGWEGGRPGVGIAAMHPFCPAPNVVSICAETARDGTLHLFGVKKDGSLVFTYQKPNSTSWAGGQPGKSIAGFQGFAPPPA